MSVPHFPATHPVVVETFIVFHSCLYWIVTAKERREKGEREGERGDDMPKVEPNPVALR